MLLVLGGAKNSGLVPSEGFQWVACFIVPSPQQPSGWQYAGGRWPSVQVMSYVRKAGDAGVAGHMMAGERWPIQ